MHVEEMKCQFSFIVNLSEELELSNEEKNPIGKFYHNGVVKILVMT